MANNAANVAGVKLKGEGYGFIAPAGTTLPTDATTPLDSAFKCLGFFHEDGVEDSRETSTEDIKDVNGTVVQTETTEFKEQVKFSCIEVNEHSLKLYYGDDNVKIDATTGAITVHSGSYAMPARVLVIEEILPGGKAGRRVYPLFKVTEWESVTLKTGQPYSLGVTGTCSPYTFTEGSGATAKTWSDSLIEYAQGFGSALNAPKDKEVKGDK